MNNTDNLFFIVIAILAVYLFVKIHNDKKAKNKKERIETATKLNNNVIKSSANIDYILSDILITISENKQESDLTEELKTLIAKIQDKVSSLRESVKEETSKSTVDFTNLAEANKFQSELKTIKEFLNDVWKKDSIVDLHKSIKEFVNNDYKTPDFNCTTNDTEVISPFSKSYYILDAIYSNAKEIVVNTSMNIDNIKKLELANRVLSATQTVRTKMEKMQNSINSLKNPSQDSLDIAIVRVKEIDSLEKTLNAFDFYIKELNYFPITKSLLRKLDFLADMSIYSYEEILFATKYFDNAINDAQAVGGGLGVLVGLFTIPLIFIASIFICPVLCVLIILGLPLVIPISGMIAHSVTNKRRKKAINKIKDELGIPQNVTSPQEQLLEYQEAGSFVGLVTFAAATAKGLTPKNISKGWVHTDRQANSY